MNRETRAFIWHFFWMLVSIAGMIVYLIDLKLGTFGGWDYFFAACLVWGFFGAFLNILDLIKE